MTAAPTVADFRAFFRCVNGWSEERGWAADDEGPEPFPWQVRLLRDWVAGAEGWPEILDLPTGSGKTAALDVAVFHLAMEAPNGPARKAPVRIAFVVDRRLIVDDSFSRAKRLEGALADAAVNAAAPEIVRRVAQRLGQLAERPDRPLLARRLRGGVPREDDWARTPSQPTILCSTVDQVGSRLLFRGYGISDSMKPVHAGLLGSDCLILLDEAHLSRPFRQTLSAIRRYRRCAEQIPPAPFEVALLTATPGEASGNRFELAQEDRDHPVLRPRLEAEKSARLIEIRGKPGEPVEDQRIAALEGEVARALEHLTAQGLDSQPVVGLVVNRVLRARRIQQRFERTYGPAEEGGPPRADVFLVIGPAREADREALAKEIEPIKTGQDEARRKLTRPRIIVATQTIEAGADLDFDALITEIAPLDALKQRFGRLNRAGRDFAAYAVILAHREDVRPPKDGDPVYGLAAAATWNALKDLAKGQADPEIVDFGASTSVSTPWIGKISAEQIEADGLLASKPDAPVLMPAYVDLWSQTSPRPDSDPEISLFLHGPDRSPATVQIVWRADIREVDLREAQTQPQARRRLLELFGAIPPRPAEAIEVSLTAARNWLLSRPSEREDDGIDFADVPQSEQETEPLADRGQRMFRWVGPGSDRSGVIHARDLRPNDLVVVPADYGGCDEFGWKPESRESVGDAANEAAAPFATRRYALRLMPGLIRAKAPGEDDLAAAERERAYAFSDGLAEVIANWRDALGRRREQDLVSAIRALDPPQYIDEALALLENPRHSRLQAILPYGEDDEGLPRGVVLLAPKGVRTKRHPAEELAGGTPATEDDRLGSLSGDALTLREHSEDVRVRAALFAEKAGVNATTAADVALAAYLHDAGKADPRFQAMLYGGDWFAVDDGILLAKSLPGVGSDATSRAGLPDGWRHEALSVRIALEHPRFRDTHDPELVLWLIGVHHGHGRPFFPHADPWDERDRDDVAHIEGERFCLKRDAGPQSLAFSYNGWDWAQIFERLKRRYGAWELARFEAIVRLADHRASEAPTRAGESAADERG